MTVLLLQTFLLLLAAFLLGASLACLLRRAISGRGAEEPIAATASGLGTLAAAGAGQTSGAALESNRFGRALSGDPGVPPVFRGDAAPVVEVQPAPAPPRPVAPEPVAPPVVAQPGPPPQPTPPPVQPAAAPPAPPAPPPKPVVQVTVTPAPEPQPAPPPPEPARPAEESYASVAVAAAAAAAAVAAAKAKADEEAHAKAEAEAAQQAAAQAAEAQSVGDDEASRFGNTVTETEPMVPAVMGPLDDLTRIRGIDVELKERLIRYGIHTFAAIAAWTPEDIRGVNQSFGFQGRIESENWVEQAQILARGGDVGQVPKRAPAAPIEVKAPVDGERLHRIIGIDPNSEVLLHANGVKRIADIAAWTDADVARFEELIGAPGRIARESWVEQARFLAHGVPARAPTEADLPPAVSEPWPSVVVPAPAEEPAASETVAEPVSSEPVVEASELASEPAAAASVSSGLRSVRSEALRGAGAPLFTGSGEVEDLKRIRGIGVLIEKKLNSLGITTYEQIANWTRGDIDRISDVLDFKGRIERENWIEQARILASGGQTEFSRRADRGEA
jgi:predicted flap endonuclease-1-like 5' DNA nuclease